jgi:carboxyl-terminal processing protease
MNRNSAARILLLAFCLKLLLPLQAASPSETNAGTDTLQSTNKPTPLPQPGADAGTIAYVTGGLLEQLHYLHHPFDDAISSKFLDQYVDSLDPQHLHFLQSDLNDFARYRTNLDNLTMLNRRNSAGTKPAYDIYARFRQRLGQRVAYADQLLKDKFDFNSDEKIALNRHEATFPQTLDDAKKLWRQRVRYEYLMEKLGREQAAKTNSAATNSVAKSDKPKTMHEEIVETISKLYHRNLRFFEEWDSNDVLALYLNALAHTYDPHSDYQAPPDAEDFAMHMNLSLFGIGASLQSEDGYCKIKELLTGPALKSKKIKVGDRIVAVAQGSQVPVNIVDMPLNKAVRLIRGPKGTEVRLTIIPAGAPNPTTREVVALIRDEIKLDNAAATGKIIELPGKTGALRLGVIDLPSFYATIDTRNNPRPKSTSADVEKLLKKFTAEKVSGVILDLRRNGGGSLEEAVRLTGLFIKRGPVVQIKDYSGQILKEEDRDPSVAYDGPLIVMTSRFSASASEIVAGALQDYGRALIVGDVSTFGKGTAQRLYPLRAVIDEESMTNDPGTLKITNSKFYRASGASTELKGVNADIILPSLWNVSTDIGENMLDNHLPWDTIESATFDKLNRVQPYVPDLMKNSQARIATNRDFAYIREDIEQFKKSQADKTISLNEKQQLKEWNEAEARKKAREAERLARKDADEKIYSITLKQADLPGLPAPLKKTNSVNMASSTNVPNATEKSIAGAEEDLDDMTDTGGTLDEEGWRRKAALEEAERIMADYITLLPKSNTVLLAH